MNLRLAILNPTGLHARPGAIFAATAKKFKARIRVRNLTKSGDWADAKSVLGVLGLGAENGHEIELDITGEDENVAAETLRRAVESGLGEAIVPAAKVKPVSPEIIPVKETLSLSTANARQLNGVPGAPGIAFGPVCQWTEQTIAIPRNAGCDPIGETIRLTVARVAARKELEQLQAKVAADATSSEAAIFDVHQMFLDDPALLEAATKEMQTGLNAESAWMDGVTQVADALKKLPDLTLSARAADVRDVGERVLKHLLGHDTRPGLNLSAPSIIIARDLTPSQTAGLDKSLVLAFCTAEGGSTSHSAILARALQLPAVVGLESVS